MTNMFNVVVGLVLMSALSLLVIDSSSVSAAVSILKFTVPKPGMFLPAGQPIIVTGTSMQPNATATNCNVQLQTNQDGYGPVKAQGPAGLNQYVNWTGQTEPLKPGLNSIEAQLMCFHPNQGVKGNPAILKHLVHNVTATELGPLAPSATTTSPGVAPKSPVLPPSVK